MQSTNYRSKIAPVNVIGKYYETAIMYSDNGMTNNTLPKLDAKFPLYRYSRCTFKNTHL